VKRFGISFQPVQNAFVLTPIVLKQHNDLFRVWKANVVIYTHWRTCYFWDVASWSVLTSVL